MATKQDSLERALGVEEGLAAAIAILGELAEVMIEREREPKPGAKANHARRVRIKAYQVAARRIQTRLCRQQRLLAKMESPADDERGPMQIRADIEKLAL